MQEVVEHEDARTPGLLTAASGAGPLLERNYWAVIRHARASPVALITHLSRHFERFAPRSLAAFERRGRPAGEPLEVGDEFDVHIRGARLARVRVIHRDAQSLTLGTLPGHPEAGRITFGAYRNRRGDVMFHIRSRARSSSRWRYVGFLGLGEAMQTRCWGDFVNRVAVACGDGVVGFIHADTIRRDDEPEAASTQEPTYRAEGG
ncbi:MAG: DUF1990 family protein [Myxococcaceae bacterium]|nr:DUF1990 family protein [Myxococcaceae bacterium]